MQIIISETQNNRCDVRPGAGGTNTHHRLADASICSYDPQACLIYNWEDVGFGVIEL